MVTIPGPSPIRNLVSRLPMLRIARISSCALLLLAGCVSARPNVSSIAVPKDIVTAEGRFRKVYVWSPGDRLEVDVRDSPEVSRTVIVRPDGFISLPLINDVKAAGLTPMELRDSLTQKFAKIMVNPEVSVLAVDVPPPSVYVLGEVTTNRVVALRDAPTAAQAIALAGGLLKSANASQAVVIRLGQDGRLRAIPIDNRAGGQPGPIFAMRMTLLEPDDIVFVPENGRSQVSRFIDEVVRLPLQTLSQIGGVYFQFRLIQLLSKK